MASLAHEGIVIIGCPRSGTTLVRRLLDAHSNISCPGETYLLTACARFLQGEQSVDGMEVGVLNGLAFAGFEREEVIRRLREFAFAFHREEADRKGKGRWAEKTAVDAFHLDEIRTLCGEHVHFVCVTRHGLDVAASAGGSSTAAAAGGIWTARRTTTPARAWGSTSCTHPWWR